MAGVVLGLAAFACAPPALAGVPAAAHGVLRPVERFAPPSLGWQPVVPRDQAFAAEREVEAPAHATTAVRAKNVVQLRPAGPRAAAALAALPSFPGASSFEAGNLEPADVQLAAGPARWCSSSTR